MSSLFGLLLLFRLDRIVLMKGFEAFDFGRQDYCRTDYRLYGLIVAFRKVTCRSNCEPNSCCVSVVIHN